MQLYTCSYSFSPNSPYFPSVYLLHTYTVPTLSLQTHNCISHTFANTYIYIFIYIYIYIYIHVYLTNCFPFFRCFCYLRFLLLTCHILPVSETFVCVIIWLYSSFILQYLILYSQPFQRPASTVKSFFFFYFLLILCCYYEIIFYIPV